LKNLLLLLLLANILYFLWGKFANDSTENGVVLIEESAVGPPIDVVKPGTVVDEQPANAENEDAPPTGRVGELSALVGRSCVTVGPFESTTEADAALAASRGDGLEASMRTTEGQLFVGHWVQIKDVADRNAADTMLATLSAGGLSDAYLVETDDEGLKISLGLFGEMTRAERVELQARSLDLPADITPRLRDATVFYIDIGLPPGRGAGAFIDRYGEEKVLLRGQANCPRPN